MVTTVLFSKETLNRLRKNLISTLEDAGVVMHRHYTLSKINEVGANFVITFTSKGKRELLRVKELLQEKFEKIDIRTDAEFTQLQLDLSASYEKLCEESSNNRFN